MTTNQQAKQTTTTTNTQLYLPILSHKTNPPHSTLNTLSYRISPQLLYVKTLFKIFNIVACRRIAKHHEYRSTCTPDGMRNCSPLGGCTLAKVTQKSHAKKSWVTIKSKPRTHTKRDGEERI